jgi:gamma-glutamylcyclotransferase (GGCT)/AIG2-like uncharacterized protein YtfP
MGDRLRREARLLGQATIAGRLYSLGRYPGLVEAADGQYAVNGEIYALSRPATSLRWLDAYEGIVPGKAALSRYARVERTVRLASGETCTAWVYLYRSSVRARTEVLGGFWIAPQL